MLRAAWFVRENIRHAVSVAPSGGAKPGSSLGGGGVGSVGFGTSGHRGRVGQEHNDSSLADVLTSWQREIQDAVQACLDAGALATTTTTTTTTDGDGTSSGSGNGGGGGGGSSRHAFAPVSESFQVDSGGAWSDMVVESGGGVGGGSSGAGVTAAAAGRGSGVVVGGGGGGGGAQSDVDEVAGSKLAYLLRLARAMFDGALLDRVGWLSWICRQIDPTPKSSQSPVPHRCVRGLSS
jgi:hypothetical protein